MADPAAADSATAPPAIAGIPALAALWRYWNGKGGGRAMPLRKDISPLDIPQLLPHLTLVDRLPDGAFRLRLVGTAVAEAYGSDATGKTIDQLLQEPRLSVAKHHYAAAFTSGRPMFNRNHYRTERVMELIVSRVVLPLADEAGKTTMLLIGHAFEYDTAVRGDYGAGTSYAARDHLEYLD